MPTRAAILDAALLAERARLGHDRSDEMWPGELRMVAPPARVHRFVGTQLLIAVAPLIERPGHHDHARDRVLPFG